MNHKILKKLSRAQQEVVNCLMSHESYIVHSKYYNHNKVISKMPMTYGDVTYHCLMQFTRPTFEVLLRKGIIKQLEKEHKDIYILNDADRRRIWRGRLELTCLLIWRLREMGKESLGAAVCLRLAKIERVVLSFNYYGKRISE